MSDASCTPAAGEQVNPCAYVGGSPLGWGPVGIANYSAKHILDETIPAPTAWGGAIAVAGFEGYNADALRQCFAAVAAKYPTGWAWDRASDVGTNIGSDALVQAEIAYDIERRACRLLAEFVCTSASETLPEWWADYGLPDDCGINDLCAKVAALGGANCDYFAELGAALGYDICCTELAPEIQAGCWSLGIDTMPPAPEFKGGGCDLGVMQLCGGGASEAFLAGRREVDGPGFNLGDAQLGECGEVFAGEPDPAGGCVEWQPPATLEPFITGRHTRPTLDYVGTAYHVATGVAGSVNDPISPLYAITGTWALGIGELCQPPANKVLCFINRYRPAHVVPLAIAC